MAAAISFFSKKSRFICMTNAERKIVSVLDAIKAHWDLHPKNGFSKNVGLGYRNLHGAGEATFSIQKLVHDSKVGFEELTPILYKLKEEGLIEKVEMLNEAM